NAIIGRSDQISNLFYATGFSGHGFLQSPAVGELVADMYLGRESFMDPTPFSASRFSSTANASAAKELHII
ncbi:MAG: FAD-binding oxidoreductase, partial [Yaniella sp.]|nr:FAD-binding oxidoreductase [Yaniella sp.]